METVLRLHQVPACEARVPNDAGQRRHLRPTLFQNFHHEAGLRDILVRRNQAIIERRQRHRQRDEQHEPAVAVEGHSLQAPAAGSEADFLSEIWEKVHSVVHSIVTWGSGYRSRTAPKESKNAHHPLTALAIHPFYPFTIDNSDCRNGISCRHYSKYAISAVSMIFSTIGICTCRPSALQAYDRSE